MKSLTRSTLLLSLFTCSCFFCLAQDNKTSHEQPPPAALEYLQENWIEFTPQEGGYAISLPGTTEHAKLQQPPVFGKFPQYFYHAVTGVGDYTIGYFDLMAELSDAKSGKSILDAERMQMLAMNKSLKFLSEKEFKFDKSEGREWLVTSGDRILRKRCFFSGTRYYQLTLDVSRFVAFHTGKPSSNKSEFTDFYQMIARRFFDSFRLLNSQAETVGNGESNDGQKRIVSAGVITGKAINLPQPSYPASAGSSGAQGSVAVEVVIDYDGKVIEAKAVSGHPLLRAAAEKAALLARFTPVKIEGVPVRVTGIITYNFSRR